MQNEYNKKYSDFISLSKVQWAENINCARTARIDWFGKIKSTNSWIGTKKISRSKKNLL